MDAGSQGSTPKNIRAAKLAIARKVFEQVKGRSNSAGVFLNSPLAVLGKYQVLAPDFEQHRQPPVRN